MAACEDGGRTGSPLTGELRAWVGAAEDDDRAADEARLAWALQQEAAGGGKRGDVLGFAVEMVLLRWNGKTKQRPGCYAMRRSRRWRWRGLVVARAAVARCRSRQSGGGARVHGGEVVPMAVEGNGVEAGVRRGMAKLMAHVVRRGDGGSNGGARLEIAGERRRWGSAWRARSRGRGEGRGAADFEGEWGGVVGVVAAVFRGTEWGRGAGSWAARSHGRVGAVQGGGGGRGKRRRWASRAAMAVAAGQPEVGGVDRWGPRSHLSAGWRERRETGGRKVDFRKARAGREREEAHGPREWRGRLGPSPKGKGGEGILFVFLFILIDAMIFVLLKLFLEL
uniref:Uncharacterized protein n=2 Tax=Oryza sativa subsp. japonica TaxID=39947 RepID=Q7Y1P4_ORYSJ|nr:hypothetical protein [Oryza sativa Japonica Group]